jgi:O-antigen ligase
MDSRQHTTNRENVLTTSFTLLVIYIIYYYTQFAGRFPVLKPLRLEFVIGSILLTFAIYKILSGQVKLAENKLNFVCLLFIAYIFLTVPLAIVKSRALDRSIEVFKLFVIFLMILTVIDDERKLKIFIFIYLSLISLLFVQPFIRSLSGEGFIYNNHMLRLAGVTNYFAHPNQLGMITASNLPFFFFFIKYFKSKLMKLICVTHILIGMRVIMLTQSRTAMLGVLVFAFILFLKSRKKLPALALMIIAAIITWFVMPQQSRDRFLTLSKSFQIVQDGREAFSEDESRAYGSMASRVLLIRRSLTAFIENPIFGVGMGCYISYSGWRWQSWFPPHNTYTQTLAELGLIGFSLLMLIVYFTLKNIRQAIKINEDLVNSKFMDCFLKGLYIYYQIFLVVSIFGIEIFSNFWWLAGSLSIVSLRVLSNANPITQQDEK